MATTGAREAPPPPVIGKVGRYTVFITPPRAKPSGDPSPHSVSAMPGGSFSPRKVALLPENDSPSPSPKPSEASSRQSSGPMQVFGTEKLVTFPEKATPSPPPVQVPPLQVDKPASKSSGSVFEFLWDAVAKVQDAHSNLDEYLADWFGLNQSKYQWALNDYYENSGKDKESGKELKPRNLVPKAKGSFSINNVQCEDQRHAQAPYDCAMGDVALHNTSVVAMLVAIK